MHRFKRRFAGALMAIPVIAGSLVVGGAPAQAIVGGTAVPLDSFPYLAGVTATDGRGTATCTGTVIGSVWVMTAAHCVVDQNGNTDGPAAVKVSVAHQRADWDKTAIRVTQVARHPNFPAHLNVGSSNNMEWPADFALLKLAKNAGEPALALAASEPSVGSTVTLAGWGCTDSSCTGGPSPILKAKTSTVISDNACPLILQQPPTTAYRPFDFCTSTGGTYSVGHGDSGGPVIWRTLAGNRLAGVISGVEPTTDTLGSVAYVLPWIHQVTGISAPPVAPTAGDLNHDGSVNCADVAAMQQAMAATPPPPSADLNHDGKVNVFDLSILLANWDPSLPPGC
jgi:trypsin